MKIKKFKNFIPNIGREVKEDKIISFSEYEPTKYNSNIVVNQIMEWLRSKLLEQPNSKTISVPLHIFFKECSVNKDKFMTFYNELNRTQTIKNFKIDIKNDNIIFSEFKNVELDEHSENINFKNVTTPAPWSTVEEAKRYIINVLLNRPDLTLKKFVELNKNTINRYHKTAQKLFYDAVEELDIPFWNKPRQQ